MSQFNQHFITLIIDRYGLEFEDDHIESIVTTWIGQYDRVWIVKAIVESLHRGRYKIKSVDSILSGWQRSGKPSYNFTPEFEREILQDFPVTSDLAENHIPSILPQLEDLDPAIQFPGLSSEQLNPEESAPFPRHDRATPILQPPTVDHCPTFSRADIVGISDNGSLAPAMASAYLQNNHSSIATPPSVASFKGEDDVKLNHINSHSRFQLFHTLRAIITPNNVQVAELDDLDPPSYSTDLA
jgi:hypothetical protein